MVMRDIRNVILSIYYHFKDGFADWDRVAILDSYSNVDKSLPCIVIDYVINNAKHLEHGNPAYNDTTETIALQIYASAVGMSELRDMMDKCLSLLEEKITWIDYNNAFPNDPSYDPITQKKGLLIVDGTPSAEPLKFGDESTDEINRFRGVVTFNIKREN